MAKVQQKFIVLFVVEFSRKSGQPPPDFLENCWSLCRNELIFAGSVKTIDPTINPNEKGTLETSKEIKRRFVRFPLKVHLSPQVKTPNRGTPAQNRVNGFPQGKMRLAKRHPHAMGEGGLVAETEREMHCGKDRGGPAAKQQINCVSRNPLVPVRQPCPNTRLSRPIIFRHSHHYTEKFGEIKRLVRVSGCGGFRGPEYCL